MHLKIPNKDCVVLHRMIFISAQIDLNGCFVLSVGTFTHGPSINYHRKGEHHCQVILSDHALIFVHFFIFTSMGYK